MIYDIIFNFEQLGYFWLLIAILFLFLELATPGLFFFITFSIGSVLAGVMAFLGYSFFIQCISLITGFLVSFLIFKKYLKVTENKRVPTNTDALSGKTGIVVKKINKNNSGLVKVEGEVWAAISQNSGEILENTTVNIIAVKGNKLIVK
ncbi:MAG: hypothetical protein SZ59_C0002G0253 [candidate division TM6 bacterium GW2011_GWF2_28_16]|nr:MAG: hypothetical protein SZ59_C0002G0253 [candidate division TM6 bacterium GW2011_GWF2_28_16]